jgi:hypothetical protein
LTQIDNGKEEEGSKKEEKEKGEEKVNISDGEYK